MMNLLKTKAQKYRKVIFTALVCVFIGVAAGFLYYRHYQDLPQSAIFFLNDAKEPMSGERVLVFSPHPDDESIGAGGYIYDSEKNGAEVRVVLVTDGNKHGLKDARYAEFQKATSTLGVLSSDLVYLNYSDGSLNKQNEDSMETVFKSDIDAFKPDVILYTSPDDTHPDHSVVGKVAEKAIKDDHFSGAAYAYIIHYNAFPQPKKYAPSMYLLPPANLVTFDGEWQRHMLSQTSEDKKAEAINCYQSQLYTPFDRSVILGSIRKNELFSVMKN